MLYTLQLLIDAQETKSALQLLIDAQETKSAGSENRKLMIGFCLQALEMSRYRLSVAITQLERDWLEKLETDVSDFLFSVPVDDTEDAVSMYIQAIKAVGVEFYGGTYPLVMFDVLCTLCTKSQRLRESLARDLVNICAEILVSLTFCLKKLVVETDYQKPGVVPCSLRHLICRMFSCFYLGLVSYLF